MLDILRNPPDMSGGQPLALASHNNCFLIDWLTVTFHNVPVAYVQALLGMPEPEYPWEHERVFCNGYPMQTKLGHITIRWGADDERYYSSDEKKSASEKVRNDMGICLDMSGQGCREFENVEGNDWLKLLHEISDRIHGKTNITRLDLAYDDHNGILDIDRIAADVRDRNYTSASRKAAIHWSDDQDNDIQGTTVEIGSRTSSVMVRIYDKAAERGFGKELHWIRIEIQLRKERAMAAVMEVLNSQRVGFTALGILRNYIQFRTPDGMDTNKCRWPIADYWEKVLLDIERISIWISPGAPYNFSKTEEHMVYQYGQALLCSLAIHGSVQPLIDMARATYPELSKKYRSAIAEVKLNRQLSKEQVAEIQDELTQLYAAGFYDMPDFQQILAEDQMFLDGWEVDNV